MTHGVKISPTHFEEVLEEKENGKGEPLPSGYTSNG